MTLSGKLVIKHKESTFHPISDSSSKPNLWRDLLQACSGPKIKLDSITVQSVVLDSSRLNAKFQSKTGFATFWRGVQNRVKIIDQQNVQVTFDNVNYARKKADHEQQNFKRCECAQCQSHIGVVYFDGPPPIIFEIQHQLIAFEIPAFTIIRRPEHQKEIEKVKLSPQKSVIYQMRTFSLNLKMKQDR